MLYRNTARQKEPCPKEQSSFVAGFAFSGMQLIALHNTSKEVAERAKEACKRVKKRGQRDRVNDVFFLAAPDFSMLEFDRAEVRRPRPPTPTHPSAPPFPCEERGVPALTAGLFFPSFFGGALSKSQL
jgi:hypothetical protein